MACILIHRSARSLHSSEKCLTLVRDGVIATVLLGEIAAVGRVDLPEIRHGIRMITHTDVPPAGKQLLLACAEHQYRKEQ